MRLLKRLSTGDISLVSCKEIEIPPYAILSHTWTEGQEVTYDELVAGRGRDKPGYAKIRFCGDRAAADGLEYFWVDTCCINKDSSAELSESINSMYRWYQQAEVCYAYIEDWLDESTWDELVSVVDFHDKRIKSQETRDHPLGSGKAINLSCKSVPLHWFTRGWTLQELIAPRKMKFFDGNQKPRGTKSEQWVIENLCRITGINPRVLNDSSGQSLGEICHAQRMSWAAYRETTRKEDIAYCLLGIFNIHMPMLYGEGEKAFSRLQEAIVASSTDLSLLAWTQADEDDQPYRGIFARHPREFAKLRQCQLDDSQFSVQDEVIMTNKGARIETSLFHFTHGDQEKWASWGVYFLSLGCYIDESLIGLRLKRIKDIHFRANPTSLIFLNKAMKRMEARTIYLARDFDDLSNLSYRRNKIAGIKVNLKASEPCAIEAFESWPGGYFDAIDSAFIVGHLDAFIGCLVVQIFNFRPIASRVTRQPSTLFTAVIFKGRPSGVSVTFLSNDQAVEFKTRMKSISEKDPWTAQEDLNNTMSQLLNQQKSPFSVYDYRTQTSVCIEGRVLDDENSDTKTVEISLQWIH